MWADLINQDKVHRALWCALYLAVTLLLQNTVFAHVALFGVHAMFVPAVVVAVGVFEGGTWGAVFGLIAGYFCAMGYPGTGMLFAVLFAVIGFGAGMLAEYLINSSRHGEGRFWRCTVRYHCRASGPGNGELGCCGIRRLYSWDSR